MGQIIRAQSGVCAEASLHGLVLLLHVVSEDVAKIRHKLARYPEQVGSLEDRFSESMLSVVLAIGEPYWDVLSPDERPDALKSIPDYARSEHPLPITPYDIAIVIRSDRVDANYLAGLHLVQWLGDLVTLAEQNQPFRCLDGRDLFGFKYTNESIAGAMRRQRALITEENDPTFAGGSHFWLLQSKLDVQRFHLLTQAEQERIMGREKVSGRRLKTTQSATHADKTAGDIWRLHMPYGSLLRPQEVSLLFSNQVNLLDLWIRNRFLADDDGQSDPLLEYVHVEHASAYFIPALNWFNRL
ncbi:peroxidase [Aliidiomarina iranensis]|uniref:Peroxidase n=1 Tax=Aliidiomarina iranensis TaxID=1434071 RepID=A0A432W2Z8_9GAMM|nr:Dyp-type peroxidase [Aliidiomarina iranensis]RUO23578.1 peroxidase [Aliidiomarina iranensis]